MLALAATPRFRSGDQGRRHRLTLLVQGDGITELTRLSVNLDSVVQELLERGRVEDVVVGRDRVVHVELVNGLGGGLGGSGFGLCVLRVIKKGEPRRERCG